MQRCCTVVFPVCEGSCHTHTHTLTATCTHSFIHSERGISAQSWGGGGGGGGELISFFTCGNVVGGAPSLAPVTHSALTSCCTHPLLHNAWVRAEGRWEERRGEGNCNCSPTGNEGARMPHETLRRLRHVYARKKKWFTELNPEEKNLISVLRDRRLGPRRKGKFVREGRSLRKESSSSCRDETELFYELDIPRLDNVCARRLLRTGKNTTSVTEGGG